MNSKLNLISRESYFYNPLDKKFYCSIWYRHRNRNRQLIINEKSEIVIKNKNLIKVFPEYIAIGAWDYKHLLNLKISEKTVSTLIETHFKTNFNKAREIYREEKEKLTLSEHRCFPYRHRKMYNWVSFLKDQIEKKGGETYLYKGEDYLKDGSVLEVIVAEGYQVIDVSFSNVRVLNPAMVKKEDIKNKMKQEFCD